MLPSWHASTGGLGKPILSVSDRLLAAWYSPRLTPLSAVLAPLALVFRAASAVRRGMYRMGALRSERLSMPVVVVGNITAGGSGKTPLVIALAAALAGKGWRPGIVSRGYGGRAHSPVAVRPDSDP